MQGYKALGQRGKQNILNSSSSETKIDVVITPELFGV